MRLKCRLYSDQMHIRNTTKDTMSRVVFDKWLKTHSLCNLFCSIFSYIIPYDWQIFFLISFICWKMRRCKNKLSRKTMNIHKIAFLVPNISIYRACLLSKYRYVCVLYGSIYFFWIIMTMYKICKMQWKNFFLSLGTLKTKLWQHIL